MKKTVAILLMTTLTGAVFAQTPGKFEADKADPATRTRVGKTIKAGKDEADVSGADSIKTADLRCEYLEDPLGIDVTRPRLSWRLESRQRGQRQTAYHLLVASSPDKLAQNTGDLWDSGKMQSDQSIHVAYDGKALVSRVQCFWKVMVWDKDGMASEWSDTARWSMRSSD